MTTIAEIVGTIIELAALIAFLAAVNFWAGFFAGVL